MGDVGLVYQIAPSDMSPEGIEKARADLKTIPEIESIQDETVFGATFFKILVVIPDKISGAMEAALDKLRALDSIQKDADDESQWEPTLLDQTLIN